MASYADQTLDQGSNFTEQLTLSDDYGVPYNLTGFTLLSAAKKSYYTSNVAINFTVTLTDANNGIVTLSANAATTANVPAGKLVYDVVAIDGGGSVSRILEGQIFVNPGVTGVITSYGVDV